MVLSDLKKPITLKWKQSHKLGVKKIACIAFIDARDVMNTLDEVCGPENWQSRFHAQAGKLFCSLSIKVNNEWISKEDAGMDTQVQADKGAASSAFKRAANMWGIGRFAYGQESFILDIKEYKGKEYPCTNDGKVLWNGELLSEYINEML